MTAGCGLRPDDSAAQGGGPSFTVAAAGDLLIHPQLTDQARKDARRAGRKGIDFRPLLAGIKPVISKADLGICHLEPVMGDADGPFQSYPDFLVPPQLATAIKNVGYDTCSTASNHSLDHGYPAVKRTLDTLDRAGVKHTGTFRTEKESRTPLIMDVKGVKVAQLSYAYGFNAHTLPADKPWLANQIDFDAIKRAERAARDAGAEVVILSIHWGREQQPNASASQIRLARRLTAETGIDLIIGHHAHVVQPMEKVNGTWVAYGLGNQVARHDIPIGLTEEGMIAWFEFTKRAGQWEVAARYEPTLTEIPGDTEQGDPDGASATLPGAPEHRLRVVALALAGDDLTPEQRARFRLAFKRTEGTVLNRGAEADGLAPLHPLPSE
ncbi:CapA family protein [Streptomyces polyrhachis]|uniref:CapA family protein n=1 Tax=Streptomyces polyrhachis TaxID=1282885 RepID=A0ABW2GD31_9ACTN